MTFKKGDRVIYAQGELFDTTLVGQKGVISGFVDKQSTKVEVCFDNGEDCIVPNHCLERIKQK